MHVMMRTWARVQGKEGSKGEKLKKLNSCYKKFSRVYFFMRNTYVFLKKICNDCRSEYHFSLHNFLFRLCVCSFFFLYFSSAISLFLSLSLYYCRSGFSSPITFTFENVSSLEAFTCYYPYSRIKILPYLWCVVSWRLWLLVWWRKWYKLKGYWEKDVI